MSSRDDLAAELRALRSMARLSQRKLSERLGVSQPEVWRNEHGATLPPRARVEQWLTVVGADDATRARVLQLTNRAHMEAPSWSHRFRGRTHLQGDVAERERQSTWTRNLETQVIPGLLQTEEYARAVMALVDMTGEVDIDAAVAARLARQQILWEPGRRFEFLIGDWLLDWEPARGVRDEQWLRLDELAMLGSVSIGVFPARTLTRSWSPFVIHDLADGSRMVTLELNHGPLDVFKPADVAIYERLWDRFYEQSRSL